MPKPRPATSGRRPPSPDPKALFDDSSEGDETNRAPVATPSEDSDDNGVPARTPSVPKDHTQMVPTILDYEARLVVEKGLHAGRVLKLGGGTASLGRSSKCDLPLKGSPGVSRRHCKVQLVGDKYVVLDLESRNGTVVNGQLVDRHILEDGDVIEVCDEHIRYVVTRKKGAHDVPPTATVAPPPKPASRTPAPVSAIEDMLNDANINDANTRLVDAVPPPNDEHATRQERSGKSGKAGAPPSGKAAAPPGRAAAPPATRPPPLPRKVEQPPVPLEDAPGPNDATASLFLDVPPGLNPEPLIRRARDELAPQPMTPVSAADMEPEIIDEHNVTAREISSPYVNQPPSSGFGVMHVLLIVALLVVAVLGVAAYDIGFGQQYLLRALRVDDAPPSQPPPEQVAMNAEQAKAPQPSVDDLPSGDEEVVEAKPVDPPVDDTDKPDKPGPPAGDKPADPPPAGDKPADPPAEDKPADPPPIEKIAEIEKAVVKPPDPPPALPPAGDLVDVRSSSSGLIARVSVKVGASVKKGQTVAFLEGSGGSKKLEALREEEEAFVAAAKKGNKAAERDLAKVRSDIAEMQRAMRDKPIASDTAGTVVEVLVKSGARVKSGDVLVRIKR